MQARDGAKNRPATGAKRPAGDDTPDGWSSPRLFVLAAAGATIGFNNFWQFPAITAQYGGGAFLIVYLAAVALLGLPLLMAEIMLGRRGRASPITTFRRLAQSSRSDPNWVLVGWLAVAGSFLVLCSLNVIAAWTLAFALRAALGTFSGLTADGIAAVFTALVHDPEKQLFWHALFVAMTTAVVARGVRDGIEVVTRWALPLALALLAGLAAYAAATDGMARALASVLLPDFTRLTSAGMIAAVGHAFFSLGLGAGVMLMYSAHVDGELATVRAAVGIATIDTVVGLVAALTVLALLYAGGVDPAAGPALVFHALPLAFDHLAGGRLLGTAFFVLLAIIAWLAAIALAQPAIAWLQEWRAWSPLRAAVACGAGAWLLGVGFILSFNHWAFSFPFFDSVKKLGLFDVAQILTAHTLLPLCGILVALFAGWALRPATTREWLGMRSLCGFDAWLWLNRVGVALLLAIVVVNFSDLFA